jgi:iron complex transport system ATP-binding protein
MLTLQNISVTRIGRRLVEDVSLTLTPGSLTVLMGENGAGKSTLLKTLSGEHTPSAGEAMLDGVALPDWKPPVLACRMAVLAQESPLSFFFSAEEVVLMGRSPHCQGYPGSKDRAIAAAALARLDVAHLAHRLYPTLSGGERARVQLARVLTQVWETVPNGARVLLLDEPVAALDIAHQHVALKVARDFAHAENAIVVAVLHDLNLTAQYADKVVLMKSGRVYAAGSVDETLIEPILSPCFSTPVRRIAHPDSDRPLLYALG